MQTFSIWFSSSVPTEASEEKTKLKLEYRQGYVHILGRATFAGVFIFMNMNKYECLNQKKKYCGESPFSGKKRVAAYCRVSTEREEQAQSFESQCDFFRCYIEEKKEWEFYKVFADEGISGTSTKKREQFNQMIAEARQGKFDLLITKEISRFARNTLDSIYYTRELRKVGVGVLFLNDGINTLEGDAELRL